MEKLYAQYHKLEYRPPKDFITTDESLNEIYQILGYNTNDFTPKSQAKSYQFRATDTYRRLIDLHYTNTKEYGKCLDRLEIHGEAFETLPLDVGRIMTRLEELGFICTEAHSRILLPHSVITWEPFHEICLADSYVAQVKVVNPLTDPENNYAKTWQFGKRPTRRSAHSEGKRLTFYDANKVHPEIAKNTVEMELQLFGDTAHKFIYSARTRDADPTIKTIGVIRSFVEFKELSSGKNKSRKATAKWWAQIVGNLPAIHLPRLGKPEPKLGNRIAKFNQELYGREQRLGKENFTVALVDYIREHGLTDIIVDLLTPF